MQTTFTLNRSLYEFLLVSLSVGVGAQALAQAAPNSVADNKKPKSNALIEAYSLRFERPDSVRASERPFIQPETQMAGKDGMEIELRLGYSEQVIPPDPTIPAFSQEQRIRLRCYNGRMIGPTIRVRPGNKFGITIKNELPIDLPEDGCVHPASGDINNPHGWNCTNLHTHGLHVSPEGISDNVFVEIEPGKNKPFRYEYAIPASHVCGTFWYHPHRHGSVAMQLTTGLAGALIVEGTGLDQVPEVKDAFERIMIFQQLKFKPDPTKTVTPTVEDIYVGSADTVAPTLINGQVQPVIRIAPGAVERWRLIHAGLASSIKVAVIKDDERLLAKPQDRVFIPLHEIAIDGIPRGKREAFDNPQDDRYPVMYPGYRWDVLFKAPFEPGRYFLVDANRLPSQQLREGEPATPIKYLAKIVIDGPPAPMKLPQQEDLLAAVPSEFRDVTDDEITDKSGKKRICALAFELNNASKDFFIDKCEYDPDRIDRVAWLNTAEEWHLTAKGNHPFHIHVNPFQQIRKDASGKDERIWRDTLIVKNNTQETIRMRFKDYSGKTVLHCHILDHEDQGMMENFLILPENKPLGGLKVRVLCNDQPVTTCETNTAKLKGKRMPEFALPGTDGKIHSSQEFSRTPLLLVFFRGVGCLHCAVQLQKLVQIEQEFHNRNIKVIAISSDDEKTLTEASRNFAAAKPFPFVLLSDGNLEAFKSFQCWDGGARHGLFVVDSARRIHSAHMGGEPFIDLKALLQECNEVAPPQTTTEIP